jgi:hypothetical protein
MANKALSSGRHALPMSVDNVGFLLDRLGQDCSPLQFLRELTQNSIEAIKRTGSPGMITWDVDWKLFDLADVMKLSITDTGDGMTGKEMLKFINQLSSSGSDQSLTANYGIGAKIAAATRNPAGVIYQSWKDGEGNSIYLEKSSETGEYGLRQWELEDGSFSHFFPLEDEVKPEEITSTGTKVVLFGHSEKENTLTAPKEAAAPSRWISKYLNTRYFEFPENVTVRVREGWDFPRSDRDRNILRTITGQKPYLDSHAAVMGVHDMSEARIHWWILRDEPAISNNSGYIESGGHVAALYQNELYDRATARAGTAQLQHFGILFGAKFVVLYAEPISPPSSRLTTNTARTTLLLNGELLPWADWAYEFRQSMPKEIAEFVKQKASSSTEKDHVKSIKDRLKGIIDLYKVSRYKPMPQGVYLSDENSRVSVGPSVDSGRKSTTSGGTRAGTTAGSGTKGIRDGELGNIYHLFEKKGGALSERVETDPFPIVQWVSIKDGSRDENEMEDRAARYLPEQNTLRVNADFRVFSDMIRRLCKEKDTAQGANVEAVVADVVHAWFEQALIETVIGIQQLKGSKEWGPDEIKKALSEEALTTAVMQRYHVHIACRRELGAKLGKALAT